ncbi:K02A2.6-like [Cordylochernes scorpioides]|uniref:K02A2.6-like n=1 Tax=Cordylochernes scorpioides TaxID=51811 RepID=A0ABY6LQ59_9ARAC|nr:K02A2.6-like [Cordylochernes scorpioides]
MEGIKPPAEFVPYSNEKKWESWRESFEIFAIAVNLESMPLVRQRAILKHIAGEKTVMIYKTFHISENDTYPNVKEMLDMFTNHFKPFKNTIQRRNAFFICVQKERQGIMEYVTELKHLAQECEFENLTESLIRDRLIIGILDREVKRKLLEDPQLKLPRAISIAMISESTCSQVESLNEQKVIEKIEKRNWVKDTIRMENAEAGPSGINPRRERIIEPSASTSNIRGILRKNVVWHWGPKQDEKFDHIKECVRNAPSLAHFDISKMLILQCDASKDAMGAALLQEDRPLAFASASFSDSQKQYSQIEKELLSVYYGCKKFEYLLSGHTFVVQTDHQPLLPLVKKPLSDISPRLQRLVMKLIAFDFKLQYKPGKYLIVADTLFRDTHPMDELPTPFLEDKRMVKMMTLSRKRRKLYAFFVDVKKAFDTVPHSLLWKKLTVYGLSTRFISLIQSYYNQMSTTIRWNGLLTEFIKIQAGVLQDDIVLLGESKINLQKKINVLIKYFEDNFLTLNQNKSKVMVSRNGGRKARSDVWFWGQLPLTITSKYTYLGYQLTASNSTQQAAKHFKNKALNAINAVWAISTKTRINSIRSSLKLLDSMALSTNLGKQPKKLG